MTQEYWTLMEISYEGNLPNFFEFYRRNSIVLDRYIDDRLLVDTPLHVAASMGNSHFAAEVLRLKPSYASKLNTSGLSPIHVALHNGRDEVVERLVEHDRNTVPHDAGEGRTALHYVIAEQNINLLRSFQLSCPDSIEDKTIRRETALHIALQHYNPMIFKRLVGWLKRTNKEYILNKADIDGNTVLHMATYNNQTEAVELLLSKEFNRKMEINAKNNEHHTALDIAIGLESHVIEAKLLRAKALRGVAIIHDPLEGIPTMAQEEEEEKKLKDPNLSLTSLPQNLSLVTQLLFFVLSFLDTIFNRLEHLDLKVVAYIIPFVPLLIDFMFTLVV